MVILLFLWEFISVIEFGAGARSEKFGTCTWPDPYNLAKIRPKFKLFLQDRTVEFKLNDTKYAQQEIDAWDNQGFFEGNRPVIFVIHGFMNTIATDIVVQLATTLVQYAKPCTVIQVGWGKGANFLSITSYPQAASNTRSVSQALMAVANAIVNIGKTGERIYLHCIGYSLGAHVCGQAKGIFNRITGLDPASPGFENCPEHEHLKPDSAECVDVIHTCGKHPSKSIPLVDHYGFQRPTGHIDIYPNGGARQPSCSGVANNLDACSHTAAIKYFIYSLRYNTEDGGATVKCMARGHCTDYNNLPNSCPEENTDNVIHQAMGYYSDCHYSFNNAPRKYGVFYVKTNAKEPYCPYKESNWNLALNLLAKCRNSGIGV